MGTEAKLQEQAHRYDEKVQELEKQKEVLSQELEFNKRKVAVFNSLADLMTAQKKVEAADSKLSSDQIRNKGVEQFNQKAVDRKKCFENIDFITKIKKSQPLSYNKNSGVLFTPAQGYLYDIPQLKELDADTFKYIHEQLGFLTSKFQRKVLVYTDSFLRDDADEATLNYRYDRLLGAVEQFEKFAGGLTKVSKYYQRKKVDRVKKEFKKNYIKQKQELEAEKAKLEKKQRSGVVLSEEDGNLLKEYQGFLEELNKVLNDDKILTEIAKTKAESIKDDISDLATISQYYVNLCLSEKEELESIHTKRLEQVQKKDPQTLAALQNTAMEKVSGYLPSGRSGTAEDFKGRVTAILKNPKGNAADAPKKLLANTFSVEIAKEELQQLYGTRVVKDVFQFYNISSALNATVDLPTLKALVVGIQANLTMEDLEAAYNSGKLKEIYPEKLREGHWPTTFDELTEDQTIQFLAVLRSPTALEAAGPRAYYIEPYYSAIYEQVAKDIAFLQGEQICEEYKFASAIKPEAVKDAAAAKQYCRQLYGPEEAVARNTIYNLFNCTSMGVGNVRPKTHFSDRVLFTMIESSRAGFPAAGTRVLKQAVKLVDRDDKDTKGNEIKGFFGIHALPTEKSKLEGKPILYAIFRGTYDEYSLYRRDTQLVPGDWEYDQMADKIKERTKAVVTEFKGMLEKKGRNEKIAVCATGHSLGAADAEQYIARLAGQIANKELDLAIDEVHNIGFNPPGIALGTAKKFLTDANRCGKNTTFYLTDHKVKGDVVRLGGQHHIGYQESTSKDPYPLNVFPTTIKHDVGEGRAAHLSSYFSQHNLDDRITKKLIDQLYYGDLLPCSPSTSPSGSPSGSPSSRVFVKKVNPATVLDVRTFNLPYEPLRRLIPETKGLTGLDYSEEKKRAIESKRVASAKEVLWGLTQGQGLDTSTVFPRSPSGSSDDDINAPTERVKMRTPSPEPKAEPEATGVSIFESRSPVNNPDQEESTTGARNSALDESWVLLNSSSFK